MRIGIGASTLAQQNIKGKQRSRGKEESLFVMSTDLPYRIVTNGLTNAIKFCPDGDILISLRTTPDHKSVIIEVQDSGIGIAAEALPRLMQPFTKMDSHSLGAGLGLYITKSLVANMGGDLFLRSTLHRGTTLTVTLPVLVADTTNPHPLLLQRELRGPVCMQQGAARASPSASVASLTRKAGAAPPVLDPPRRIRRRPGSPLSLIPDDSPAAAINPIRILIIDDNTICRKILRMAFRHSAVPVICEEAEDGQAGVDTFATFEPDIVFTDVSMPVMDGVTAAGRMRDLLARSPPKEIPCKIYALTGLGSSDPRMHALGVNGKAALDGWLTKGKDMLDAVEKVLAEVEAERADPGGKGRSSKLVLGAPASLE